MVCMLDFCNLAEGLGGEVSKKKCKREADEEATAAAMDIVNTDSQSAKLVTATAMDITAAVAMDIVTTAMDLSRFCCLMGKCQATRPWMEEMMHSTRSLVRRVQGNMFLMLCFLIWNPLSLMRLELALIINSFILSSSLVAKKMLLIVLLVVTTPFGISPERMLQNKDLSSFFKILTTTNDRNNKAYVSTVEAYNYPVVGVQWHPEKNAFEWQKKSYPHSANAIQVTQSTANFVVSEARKSNHRPMTLQQEKDYLIYNYNPVYAGKQKASYDQIYLFP